jgi:GAF domain-containing protein
MTDPVHQEALALADDQTVEQILQEVCRMTGMGFAAVARVTEDRWIACQVLDKIEFGLEPGDELEVATTICNDIRKTTTMVVIDDAGEDEAWRTHHTPKLYGFKSYISVPVMLPDGSFFGTLCAIDPNHRELRGSAAVAVMQDFAARIADIVARGQGALRRAG